MADNLSLTSTISSLPEPAIVNHQLNIILGSGLATLGILGFLLLITTIVVFKDVSEASYIILLSFAFCDMGHLAIVMSHVVPELILGELHWAWAFETFISHSNLLFWYSSLGHLSLMAINRFYAVCRPMILSTVFSVTRTWKYCVCIWFIGFLLCMTPFTGILCCRKIFDIHHDAEEEEVKPEQNNILKIITMILNWLTVVAMAFCYIAVFRRLRAKASAAYAKPQTARQLELLALKDKKRCRLSYQFSIISVLFCLLLCCQLTTELGYKKKWAITTLQFLYTLNSAVNPVIYLGFNSALRKQVVRLVTCKLGSITPGITYGQQLMDVNFVEAEPLRNLEALHQKPGP